LVKAAAVVVAAKVLVVKVKVSVARTGRRGPAMVRSVLRARQWLVVIIVLAVVVPKDARKMVVLKAAVKVAVKAVQKVDLREPVKMVPVRMVLVKMAALMRVQMVVLKVVPKIVQKAASKVAVIRRLVRITGLTAVLMRVQPIKVVSVANVPRPLVVVLRAATHAGKVQIVPTIRAFQGVVIITRPRAVGKITRLKVA
jgi:hypothetical protein